MANRPEKLDVRSTARVRVSAVPGQIVAQPDIAFGDFRVYRRTDGLYVVLDLRRNLPEVQVAGPCRKIADAELAAQRLYADELKALAKGIIE